jgi:hypothetical protein
MRTLVLKIISVSLLLIAFGCKDVKNEPLTDKRIGAYINAYKELRNAAPDMLEQANSGLLDVQKEGLPQFNPTWLLPSKKQQIYSHFRVAKIVTIT